MNASRAGIEMEKSTVRWIELLFPLAVSLAIAGVGLWVAQARNEEKFSNQHQRMTQIETAIAKQDDRMTAIYQALADIRTGVAEIKGRLQHMEATK